MAKGKGKFYEMKEPTPLMKRSARHRGPGPSDAGQRLLDAGHKIGNRAKDIGERVVGAINPFD